MSKKILYWAPRILSIVFVGFLFLFSFDVVVGVRWWEVIIATLMHMLIPIIVLVGVIIAWKKDLVGSILFFGFALYYVLMVGFNRPWSWYASISAPAILVGILYLLNYLKSEK